MRRYRRFPPELDEFTLVIALLVAILLAIVVYRFLK